VKKIYGWFLLVLTLLGVQESYTQSLAHLDSAYLLMNEVPNKHLIELAPKDKFFPKIDLFNIPIEKPESEIGYLLTISALPSPQYSFAQTKRISDKEFREKRLTFDSLRKLVVATVDSSFQDEFYSFSHWSRTYNVIPVSKEVDGYYAYRTPVLSECFGIIRQPAPFQLEELNRGDWVYINTEVVPFFSTNVLNLSAPIITGQDELKYAWWIIDESNKKSFPMRYHEFETDSIKAVNEVNNQFMNRILLRSINEDSIYHFEYTPSENLHGPPRTGSTSFYYHPCVGIIAATYQYHFEKYHRWIPGVERVEDIMFTGVHLNGAEFEPYFRMKCLE